MVKFRKFLAQIKRWGKLFFISVALVINGPASAQNPPTSYTAATTPYGGTESWYCEVVTGTLNKRCSFADIVTSITALTNLVTIGTITSGTLSTGLTINAANVTWSGIIPAAAIPVGAATISTPADLTGGTAISSATAVMAGFAGTITPVRSGKIIVSIYGSLNNNTAGGQCGVKIRTGTGTAPTNGAALTGTAVGGQQTITGPNAGTPEPYSMTVVVTGLALSTARWLDISVVSDGTVICSAFGNTVSAAEL